jgi:hypothetical protein
MFRRGKWLRTGLWLVVILALCLVIVLFFRAPSNTRQVTVSSMLTTIKADIQHGQTDTLEVADGTLTLTQGNNSTKEVA